LPLIQNRLLVLAEHFHAEGELHTSLSQFLQDFSLNRVMPGYGVDLSQVYDSCSEEIVDHHFHGNRFPEKHVNN
jgi:hypothetical protein